MFFDFSDVFASFNWEIIYSVIIYIWEMVRAWWWIIVPVILYKPFLFLWLWRRNEVWLSKQKFILLDIKIPKDIIKPIRAMENVMASLHGIIYQPPDWWEKWIEGQVQTSISFEIVSIEGETHFYIRINKPFKDVVEAAIYAQYPNVEIEEVTDYTKSVPQDIPNKDWSMFGVDYKLLKFDAYPIRTYRRFETEREPDIEGKVDPITHLLEGFAKIGEGEQFWIQIIATPFSEKPAQAFIKKAQELRDELVKRKKPVAKPKPMIQEAIDFWVSGPSTSPSSQPEKEVIPPEMKLTPGEKEIVTAIEEKVSKLLFKTNIRCIYLGKKNSFFKPKIRLVFSFFNSFATSNLNALYPWGKTLSKIHKSWFLPLNLIRPQRYYLRCRKIFRNYISRVNPLFPRVKNDKGIFILNTEELASLFHFPTQRSVSGLTASRIKSKKGLPPLELPTA